MRVEDEKTDLDLRIIDRSITIINFISFIFHCMGKTKTRENPTEFAIESNVEIPQIMSGRNQSSKYPFRYLEEGESFFVPGITATDMCPFYQYYPDMKFTARTIWDTTDKVRNLKGARVWRIA